MPLREIPEIEHLTINSVFGIKKTGHTQAVEVICQNADKEISCILKPYFSLPFGRHTCARELIGSILGIAFGLRVPTPYIIEIDDNCPNLTDDLDLRNRLTNSKGANFGCKYIDSGPIIANFIDKNNRIEAANIFAFDMIIQNDDRRYDNPNMFQDKFGFLIFDHEMAFPYSRPDLFLGIFPNPWEFAEPGSIIYTNHFCYKYLKHEKIDLSIFQENLKGLEGVLPYIINNALPNQWNGNEIDNIVKYLILASNNADLVVRKIYEVLA